MVAERVVARAAEQRLGRGGAARHARARVVALAAVAPQVLDGAIADVADLRCALPDRSQPVLAPAAAGVRGTADARAALDRAVALDAEHRDAGEAAGEVALAALLAAQLVLERPEVAEVVARPDRDVELAAAIRHAIERLEQL